MQQHQQQQTISETEEKNVERIVKGGATAFPREDPRPEPMNITEAFIEYVKCAIRLPALCTLSTVLVYPYYKSWLEKFLARGHTMRQAFAISLLASHLSLYFGMFGFFEICDRFKIFRKYKLLRLASQEPAFPMKVRTMIELTAGQVLNYFLAMKLWDFLEKLGAPHGTAPLPSYGSMFFSFFLTYTVNKFGFSAAHRLFHHGPLYRAIHKKHHNYVGTVSIAAEHAHPVEAVFANLLPTITGCLITHPHPLVWWVWLTCRLEETFEAHSGYCFAGSWLHQIGLTNADNAAYHDHHHVMNKGNFGDPFTDALGHTHDHWLSIGRNEGYVEMSRKVRAEEGFV